MNVHLLKIWIFKICSGALNTGGSSGSTHVSWTPRKIITSKVISLFSHLRLFCRDFTYLTPYLIFVTGTTGGARGEKIVMWRNLSIWQIVRWRNSPHDRLSCGKYSPHEKCKENLKCGEIMCTIYGVLSHFTIFCCTIIFLRFTPFCREISFGMIYALLRGEKLS